MPNRSDRQQTRLLQLDELVGKIKPLASEWPVPDGGWIASVRDALGMSGDQLGARLGITRSSVRALELRERDGGATLEALRAVAAVLGCDVVYALVPKAGSFTTTLRKQAELADAVRSESETTDTVREERIRDLMHERPRVLWEPGGARLPDAEAPRRKGLKPGPPRGRPSGRRASGTIAPSAAAPAVPQKSPQTLSEAPATPIHSGPTGAPESPTPRPRPVADDSAGKASRRRPRAGRRAADIEQLDAFG